MNEENKDKKVLVTGASGGIGRAIALAAAREGYEIVAHYNHGKEKIDALIQEITAGGGKASTLQFDIANRADCASKLEQWSEENGAFWGIVCNAGICHDNAFPALSDENWDSVIHTNLDGFYNVLKPLVMPLCRKKKGRIITIASVSGVIGNRGQVNYSASKAGIIGATKALAVELASRKITVNCIAPRLYRNRHDKRRSRRAHPALHPHGPCRKTRRSSLSGSLPLKRRRQLHYQTGHQRQRRHLLEAVRHQLSSLRPPQVFSHLPVSFRHLAEPPSPPSSPTSAHFLKRESLIK